MGYTTWRKLISSCMKENNDDWKYVIKSTLSEKEKAFEYCRINNLKMPEWE